MPDAVMRNWPAPPRPEAFYGPLGDFVRRLEPETESHPMALMVQGLVGFGNLIGRHVHFQVEADKHYANLNAITVGNSSKSRKGTSWGHVNQLLRQLDPSWPRPLAGLSTGEGLIHQVRDPVTRNRQKWPGGVGRGGDTRQTPAGVGERVRPDASVFEP